MRITKADDVQASFLFSPNGHSTNLLTGAPQKSDSWHFQDKLQQPSNVRFEPLTKGLGCIPEWFISNLHWQQNLAQAGYHPWPLTRTETHTQTNKQTNKQTNRHTNKPTNKRASKQTSKQANKQTNKQADKQTSKQANKQTNRQADKQTSKEANKQTSKQASKQASKRTNHHRETPHSRLTTCCIMLQRKARKHTRKSGMFPGRAFGDHIYIRQCTSIVVRCHPFCISQRSSCLSWDPWHVHGSTNRVHQSAPVCALSHSLWFQKKYYLKCEIVSLCSTLQPSLGKSMTLWPWPKFCCDNCTQRINSSVWFGCWASQSSVHEATQ